HAWQGWDRRDLQSRCWSHRRAIDRSPSQKAHRDAAPDASQEPLYGATTGPALDIAAHRRSPRLKPQANLRVPSYDTNARPRATRSTARTNAQSPKSLPPRPIPPSRAGIPEAFRIVHLALTLATKSSLTTPPQTTRPL